MVSDKRCKNEVRDINNFIKGENFNTSNSFAKLLWFKNNGYLQKNFTVIGANEWISYQITGELFMDPLNGSKYILRDENCYNPDLLTKYKIELKQLPRLEKVGTKFELRKELFKLFQPRMQIYFNYI